MPNYVLGDWGTSRLRLYLMDHDRVVEEREGAGIGTLSASAGDALTGALAPWNEAAPPTEIVLCGMASSRNGLLELPYAQAPTDSTQWARAAGPTYVGAFRVLLATGIQCGNATDGFDVMRGEDAQIFGAMRLDPGLCQGLQCLVLPGTHSKWVKLAQGVVTEFQTVMTGEVYAVLSKHSILLKSGGEIGGGPEFDDGFAAGANRGGRSGESLLAALFQTRTAQLLQGRSRAWAAGFLSGLLIGHEVSTLSSTFDTRDGVTIIADADLASLYRRVFTTRGISTRVLDGGACALSGLRLLREHHQASCS